MSIPNLASPLEIQIELGLYAGRRGALVSGANLERRLAVLEANPVVCRLVRQDCPVPRPGTRVNPPPHAAVCLACCAQAACERRAL